jgi:hypothetical protein
VEWEWEWEWGAGNDDDDTRLSESERVQISRNNKHQWWYIRDNTEDCQGYEPHELYYRENGERERQRERDREGPSGILGLFWGVVSLFWDVVLLVWHVQGLSCRCPTWSRTSSRPPRPINCWGNCRVRAS